MNIDLTESEIDSISTLLKEIYHTRNPIFDKNFRDDLPKWSCIISDESLDTSVGLMKLLNIKYN